MVDPEDRQAYNTSGNVQLNLLMGAETVRVGTSVESAMDMVRERGGKPYLIPSGASQHPLGGLGYTRLMYQIGQWEATQGMHFDAIFDVAGGGSTLAGLVVGSKLLDQAEGKASSRKLIGVSIFAKPADETRDTVLGIAKTAAGKVGIEPKNIAADDFIITDLYNAGAYGRLDERTSQAVKLVARTEGILLDPVYTGKAMAGMIDMIQKGELNGAKDVLFMHTGGQAALSAYSQLR
jgi:1-aminocyclopropane-1-carboxylate deaminase